MSLDFSPFKENSLLTGSSDKSVALWDLRRMDNKLFMFDFHDDEVLSVKWNTSKESHFTSVTNDGQILFWNVSLIGSPLSVDDFEDGPPELLVRYIIN